ncbi:MAG: phosphatidylserine decarboxylase [Gammaproteobacteria bacterium]|nr:phosphatidylserine decarboxylase [Gammaproteobacteria bacterium]
MADYLFVLPQYILPHHALSRCIYRLTRLQQPWLKNRLIKHFIRLYGIDMTIAQSADPQSYADFNAFFTRALKPGARPVADDPRQVVSPVDGKISQIGAITDGRIFQAKGRWFDLQTLLGGDSERAKLFHGGSFATIYLSPKDYHRIHMPLGGRLLESIYIPGRLFSVNDATARTVPGLFARNERLVALFDSDVGPMAMVPVGALFVSGIETIWSGYIPRPPTTTVECNDYRSAAQPVVLARSEEMGRFNMGSTVVLLFAAGQVEWAPTLQAGDTVVLGQSLATCIVPNPSAESV